MTMTVTTTAATLSLLFSMGHGLTTHQMIQLPRASRRTVVASSIFGGIFGSGSSSASGSGSDAASARSSSFPQPKGPTNEVLKNINGMKQRRLGGSDIIVSALGLGTQRWVSTDFNAPTTDECFAFMDEAILKHGVNLIDTAEQYPIPSRGNEGDTERCIGQWMKDRNVARDKVVIATKITGGRNVTPKNIKADCEGSLKRLGTDYIDVYQVRRDLPWIRSSRVSTAGGVRSFIFSCIQHNFQNSPRSSTGHSAILLNPTGANP
jgi:Aldo/keto reductase family